MAALRCADVTLQHGYRYFVGVSMADVSTSSSFSTPGYARRVVQCDFGLR
jgi:hypothetical protein